MKDSIKVLKLMFFGLLSAVFIYPFLHESGHVISALFSGAKLVGFTMFPLPNTVCEFDHDNTVSQMMSALGGVVFPYVLSFVLVPKTSKKFIWWYVFFLMRIISIYATFLSMISLFLIACGVPLKNVDVSVVFEVYPDYTVFIVAGLIMMISFGLIVSLKDKPITHFKDYFED